MLVVVSRNFTLATSISVITGNAGRYSYYANRPHAQIFEKFKKMDTRFAVVVKQVTELLQHKEPAMLVVHRHSARTSTCLGIYAHHPPQ